MQADLLQMQADSPYFLEEMRSLKGLSKAIARLMAAQNPPMTQVALSRKLGVGTTTVNKFFREQWNPEAQTIGRILDALGCTAHDLAAALDEVNARGVAPGGRKVTEKFLQAFAPGRSADYYRGIADALEQVEMGLGELDESAAKGESEKSRVTEQE